MAGVVAEEAVAEAEAEAEVEEEAEAEAQAAVELEARDAVRQPEVAAAFAATGSRPRPKGRRGTVLRREFVSACISPKGGPAAPVPAAPVRSQMLLAIEQRRETAESRFAATTYVDPRLAHEERLLAEKAGTAAGGGPPAALAIAIGKRREAVEAQMRALDEGLEVGFHSPRRAREAELAATRTKKFNEKHAKKQGTPKKGVAEGGS